MRQSTNAAQTTGSPAASTRVPLMGIAKAICGGIVGFIAWRAVKAFEVELAALDDRMLKDIGFTRSEWTGGRDRRLRGE